MLPSSHNRAMVGISMPEIPIIIFVEWVRSGSEAGDERGVTVLMGKSAAKERRGIGSLVGEMTTS